MTTNTTEGVWETQEMKPSLVSDSKNKWSSQDVGMLSQADEASKKLQYSLDELIEQTSFGNKALKNNNKKDNKQQRVLKNQSFKQILRNKKYNMRNSVPPLPYVYNPLLRPPYLYVQPFGSSTVDKPFKQTANANVELALAEINIAYPPMVPSLTNPSELVPSPNESLIVKFKQTDVVKVLKQRGELVLDSGGWKTISTRFVINTALKPLGLWIELANKGGSDSNKKPLKTSESDWTVVDGMSYLAAFTDGMVIGQIGAQTVSQLLARASVIAQHLKQMKNNAIAKSH